MLRNFFQLTTDLPSNLIDTNKTDKMHESAVFKTLAIK